MSNDIQEISKEVITDQMAIRPDEIDALKVIRRVDAITKAIDGAVKVSLQRTNSSDWVKMGDKYYLQASGCQKVRGVFGIYFRNKSVIREDYSDSYGYFVTGLIGSEFLDRLYGKEVTMECDGGRSSKDAFFTGKDGKKEPDPMDIRKAAVSNFEARAISSFLGIKNFTQEDLTKNGININAIQKVDYQKGAEGGGNSSLISEAQRKRLWAICKSKSVSEDSLRKYLKIAHKIDSTEKITRTTYESICNAVETDSIVDVIMEAESGDK